MTLRTALTPTPVLSYFICSTPRTGSNLLSEALERTHLAGNPKEYFDVLYEDFWQERLKFTDETYFAEIIAHSSTANGIFGSKLFWHQTENLMHKLGDLHVFADGSQDTLASYFPNVRYIWLKRRDTVRQAISYIRAEHTNQWWEYENAQRFTPRYPEYPHGRFDFKEIDDFHNTVLDGNAQWERYFRQRSIQPLVLFYEEMAVSYEATLVQALHWLGIPIPDNLTIAPPRLQKQADAVSEQWVKQYHEHARKHYPQVPPIKVS